MIKNILFSISILNCFFLLSCKNSSPNSMLIPLRDDNIYSYVDKDRKKTIEQQFSDARMFSEGLALASPKGDNAGLGFIDYDGKFVIPAVYSNALPFSEGVAFVYSEKNGLQAIDKAGKTLFQLQDVNITGSFSEGLAPVAILTGNKVKWGFVDKTGNKIIAPQFDDVLSFMAGTCPAMNEDNKWGLIDKNGKWIVKCQYDNIKYYSDSTWTAAVNKKYGIINLAGQQVLAPNFDDLIFDKNLLLVRQNDKWGWANKEGEFLIHPQFDDALNFGNGNYAPVKSGKLWGYVNLDGEMSIAPKYDMAGSLQDELAWVSEPNHVGLISFDGKNIRNISSGWVPFDYPYLNNNSQPKRHQISNEKLNNSPVFVALNYFFYSKFPSASAQLKMLCTPDSYPYIDSLARSVSGGAIQSVDFMFFPKTDNQIKNIEEVRESATVTYTVPGDPTDKMLHLVKHNDKWLVEMGK